MVRRLILFVLVPLTLSYGLALLAISLGVRQAGLHWLAAAPHYLIFGSSGLAVAIAQGRGQRRDFVEMAGLLCGMLVGYALWGGLGNGRWLYVVFDTALAGLILGAVLGSARLLETLLEKTGGNVR